MAHVPGTRQLSTAVSDAVLAAACFWGMKHAEHASLWGATSIGFIGSAAFIGALRFYGVRQVAETHNLLSFVGSTWAMLLLGVSFLVPYNPAQNAMAFGGASAATIAAILLSKAKPELREGLTMAFSLFALGSAAFKSYVVGSWAGLAGAAVIGISGAIGTTGKTQGVYNVDIFHYGLATGLVLLARALTEVW